MRLITAAAALALSTVCWPVLAQDRSPPRTPTAGAMGGPEVTTEEIRSTTPLMENWRFIQDDNLTDEEALASNAAHWEEISLPHTWNAEAATIGQSPPYKRGLGWYKREIATPTEGERHWLEIGAASLVADVWLNGQKLGQHKGGFTQFRFDVTDILVPNGTNVLLVKVDNSQPVSSGDPTDIPPLGGDYIFYGGLYRHVALVSTAGPAHFDLGDMGGPGVYATTNSISGGNAAINVRTKLKNDADEGGRYVVRVSLLDEDSRVVRSAWRDVSLNAGSHLAVPFDLVVNRPRLWQGVEDPYQYKLVAELLSRDGQKIDKVVQNFGIRQIRFDPEKGLFLNGRYVPLHGVAVHNEAYGKGWAVSPSDIDKRLALVKEIGANTIRLGHYPFDRYTLESLNRMGLVAWSELPVGIGVTPEVDIATGAADESVCPQKDASRQFRASARQQLQEMIRQQFNHASVGMWSLGNETTFMHKDCEERWHDNLTPVFQELQSLAKGEDPNRPTTYADFLVNYPVPETQIDLGGITDLWARNQYPLWYSGPPSNAADILDGMRAAHPDQPLGIAEYGAGAAVTHHTDNVRGGPPEDNNPGVPVVYQPEEYASWVHEQTYAMILGRNYLYASYVWNMFDFASNLRNEGDVRGVNTKGLVTFDLQTKKDPFYFYKANWSSEPVTYITSRRYTDRAYAITDVKIYSNADSVELWINGRPIGSMDQQKCMLRVCLFKNVRLDQGQNEVVAVGHHGDESLRDSVAWSLNTTGVNIAAGQLTTGFRSTGPIVSARRTAQMPTGSIETGSMTTGSTSAIPSGELFGSDNFFIGGEGDWLISKSTSAPPQDWTPPRGTDSPQLFKNFRRGQFSYFVPLDNGTYTVTLGFLEPNKNRRIRERIFDVVANGELVLDDFDIMRATNGQYRTAIHRTFTAEVNNGFLKLDFVPVISEAVVSNISIRRQ